MVLAAVLVFAAGVARLVWPLDADHVTRVLGEQFTTTAKGNSNPSLGSNNGCGNGNGGSSGSKNCDNSGHSIDVAAQVDGTLRPGGSAILHVSVQNLNNQPVTLTRIHPSVSKPPGSSCDLDWFPAPDYTTATPIAKSDTAYIDMTLGMTESGTNQDSCKSTELTVSVTATVTG